MRILRFPFAALLLVLGTAFFCNAEIACEVNQTIGAGGVTGDIITDGTIGVLGAADIVSWNLLLNDGTNTALLTPSNGPPICFCLGPTYLRRQREICFLTSVERILAFLVLKMLEVTLFVFPISRTV